MNKRRVQAAVIGSGFAGIVAANRLAASGIDVLVMDENLHIGGQILRRLPEILAARTSGRPDSVRRTGFRFVENLRQRRIQIMNRTTVLGIYPGPQMLVEENETGVFTLAADAVLLAPGARERFLPF